jgi:hypothetical protein
MEAQPRTDIGKLFHTENSYVFYMDNAQRIVGTFQGATLLDSDWVLIVKENRQNLRNLVFSKISNWIESCNETTNQTTTPS